LGIFLPATEEKGLFKALRELQRREYREKRRRSIKKEEVAENSFKRDKKKGTKEGFLRRIFGVWLFLSVKGLLSGFDTF